MGTLYHVGRQMELKAIGPFVVNPGDARTFEGRDTYGRTLPDIKRSISWQNLTTAEMTTGRNVVILTSHQTGTKFPQLIPVPDQEDY